MGDQLFAFLVWMILWWFWCLCFRSWTCGLRFGCGPQRGWVLWLPSRVPIDPLPRWWHWIRNGYLAHFQDPWGISWQDHEHLLSCTFSQGVWHCCWTLQRYFVSSPIGGKYRWDLLYWQRSLVWHLLPYPQIGQSHLWWFEPFGFSNHVWSDHMFEVPRSAECWLEEVGGQHGTLPQVAFLHAWFRSFDCSWQPTIQVNTFRQKYFILNPCFLRKWLMVKLKVVMCDKQANKLHHSNP